MNVTTTKFIAFTALAAVCTPAISQADTGAQYRIGDYGLRSSLQDYSADTSVATGNRAEMLFKLAPAVVDESIDEQVYWDGQISLNRIDFLRPEEARMHDIHQGFSYSAAIDLEQSEEFQSESRLISSRQLGIHYGRLGSVNYSGVDLSFRQFSNEPDDVEISAEDNELWSLGVTTGRRFSMTGLEPTDPIWTVSLRGQFNFSEQTENIIEIEDQQWYLSPGFHWQRESFQLSADVLMPFMQSGEFESETDYRIRANIKKRF